MKRIEAFVQTDKTSLVVDAIKKAGAKGLTVFSGRGQGKGKRPMVESSRGTTRHVAEYSEIDSIVTVVDESNADAVIIAIINAAGTGSKGDGKIFVSTVDDVIDIAVNKKVLLHFNVLYRSFDFTLFQFIITDFMLTNSFKP